MMPFPRYTWDRNARQYRDANGRFVSLRDVRQALDQAIRSVRRGVRSTTQRMMKGELTVAEWRTAMQESVKDVHLFSAAAAKGGWGRMTQSDFGRVGQIVRRQYRYLEGFASELAGGLPRDGRVLVRSNMYVESGRGTFHKVTQVEMEAADMDEERSVLHPADHCDECVDEADKGWVPIGTVIPIGERTCLGNCHCTMQYRQSAA